MPKNDPATPRNFTGKIIQIARAEARKALLENESENIARAYGIVVPQGCVARSKREAIAIASSLGFPVVLKILSRDILHKTEYGGVITSINSKNETALAYERLLENVRRVRRKAKVDGVLVQKMMPKTAEFVVGGKRDSQFGPMVMFGVGGIYLELYNDVAFRLSPISRKESMEMLKEVKGAQLLTGFRGSERLDTTSVAKVIRIVGKIMTQIPEINSIDVNPLLAYPHGAVAVDVRMTLE